MGEVLPFHGGLCLAPSQSGHPQGRCHWRKEAVGAGFQHSFLLGNRDAVLNRVLTTPKILQKGDCSSPRGECEEAHPFRVSCHPEFPSVGLGFAIYFSCFWKCLVGDLPTMFVL